MRRLSHLPWALAGLLLGATPGLWAAVGPAQLQRAVENYLSEQKSQILAGYGGSGRLEYEITSLDSRLSLADCDTPLDLEVKNPAGGGRRLNIQVRCRGSSPWAIYVPVTVQVWREVVVLNTPVARGQTLDDAQLKLAERDIAALHSGYFTDPDQLVGHVTQRALPADAPVLAAQVETPLMIRRGQQVVLVARSGGLEVKGQGVAEGDARQGEVVTVRSSRSERLVEGRAVAPGRVQVAF